MDDVVDWREYYAATAQKPLHPMLGLAEPHIPREGLALDLGCGVGRATQFLRERGLRVWAIDREAEAIEATRARVRDDAGVELVLGEFQSVALPPAEVVVALFSLFFLPPEEFAAFWPTVVGAIRPGGVFVGQFLGPNDDWRDRGYTLHDAAAVRSLMEGFDVLYSEEAERDGETAVGSPKHWHVHHVIARRQM